MTPFPVVLPAALMRNSDNRHKRAKATYLRRLRLFYSVIHPGTVKNGVNPLLAQPFEHSFHGRLGSAPLGSVPFSKNVNGPHDDAI